jgi:hypothetical protein
MEPAMNINSTTSIDALALKQTMMHARKGREAASASAPTRAGEGVASPNASVETRAAPPQAGLTAAPESHSSGPYGEDDMQNLLNDWGKTDSAYDIDGNGMVNVDDLIAMIFNWQQPAPAPEADPAQTLSADGVHGGPATPTRTGDPMDALGIMDEDSPDPALIDGVDSTELRPVSTTTTTTMEHPEVALSSPLASADEPPATPIEGPYDDGDLGQLMNEWGTTNSEYDLDGNGAVDVDDLINMIMNWGSPAPVANEPATRLADRASAGANANISLSPAIAKPNDIEKPLLRDIDKPNLPTDIEKPRRHVVEKQGKPDASDTRPSLAASELRTVSGSLVDRLLAAGFTDRPPTNLGDIVDKLNLSPGNRSDVMQYLNNAYPNGLGVNVRA